MKQTEALQMCLEYIETNAHERKYVRHAIKEALAQPEHDCTRSHPHEEMSKECELRTEIARFRNKLAQPEQEPVAFYRCNGCGHKYQQMHPTSCDCMKGSSFEQVNYYTTPPQRKPLTDEEIGAILEGVNAYGTRLYTFARAIEAKLKEKNT